MKAWEGMSDDEPEVLTSVAGPGVTKETYTRALNVFKNLNARTSQDTEWNMMQVRPRSTCKAPPTVQQMERSEREDQAEAAARAREGLELAKEALSFARTQQALASPLASPREKKGVVETECEVIDVPVPVQKLALKASDEASGPGSVLVPSTKPVIDAQDVVETPATEDSKNSSGSVPPPASSDVPASTLDQGKGPKENALTDGSESVKVAEVKASGEQCTNQTKVM